MAVKRSTGYLRSAWWKYTTGNTNTIHIESQIHDAAAVCGIFCGGGLNCVNENLAEALRRGLHALHRTVVNQA